MCDENGGKVGEKMAENKENAGTSKQIKQPLDDKVYDGIRGHERHILFHFFTLFSISFLIGVVFIHLSLWMNANVLSLNQDGGSLNTEPDTNKNTFNKDVIWLEPLLQYTGDYFVNMTTNGTHLHYF